MKPIIKASLVAAAISFLPFGAQAAGLGKHTVQSKLGEPLNVEIQINATQQELQSLTARVAPSDAFSQGGIPYASFVPNVRVTVENRGDRSVLKLSSDVPVNEAIASLIIQLNWDDGRVSRTYNILLDPPDLAIRPPAPVEPTVIAPVEPTVTAPVEPTVTAQPEPTPTPTPEPAPAPYQDLGDEPTVIYSTGSGSEPESVTPQREVTAPPPVRPPVEPERAAPMPVYSEALEGGDYTVRSGDTLGSIAGRRASADVSLDQMMIALYRANPTAFINNNINRLKTGAILKMPSASEVQSSSHIEARREVRVHAREFNAWRAQLASEVAVRPASPVDESAGRTRSIDTIPPPAERDQDKVVIASGDGKGNDTTTRLRRMEEDLASTQEALKDASERVKELEELTELQKQRADLLSRASQAQRQPPVSEPVPVTPQAPEPPVGITSDPVTPVTEEPPVVPEPPVVSEPPVTQEPSAPEIAVADPETQPPTPTEEQPSPISVEVEDASQKYEDPLWEAISDWRTLLGVGALLIMVLGAFLGFRSWRQNKRSDVGLDTLSQDATSMFPSEATSIFGDNGGQNVDTTGSSVIHTDFSQTGLSIDTNEGVDPVAEADVYMAYGRDSQAEEILNDALKADPKRGAIYVKLLEIYAQRQDLTQFETTASELFSRTQGLGRDWEKAAQMGRRLDPSNPLYSGKPSEQKDGEVTRLPGLEPAIEEPSKLNMGGPSSIAPLAGSGPSLADLDFGASPASGTFATDTGQLKNTVAAQGRMDDMLSTRVTGTAIPDIQIGADDLDEVVSDAAEVDFQFEPPEDETPKPPGSIDFDLGKSKQPSETGKQPISVTVSKPSGTASKKTIGVSSRKAGSRTSSPKAAANDLAGPLDFDVPARDQNANAFGDMSATVVLPSALGGDERSDDVTMDLEKTGFDPNALDFDLDLDLKPDTAAVPASKGRPSSVPVSSPVDVVDAGEIDTKLELAMAYGDMGDTEGALELLHEVVVEGNAAQKAEAKALIAKLG